MHLPLLSAPGDHFSVCGFAFHMNGNIIGSLLWLTSLTQHAFRFPSCCITCQGFLPFYGQDMPRFVYPFISWWTLGLFPHFGYFEYGAFMYMFLCEHMFSVPLGIIFRSGIAGQCGSSTFNLLSNCQTVLQSGCTIWCAHQQCTRVPVSPHPPQYWLFSVLTLAILVGVMWNRVTRWASPLTSDLEHLFHVLISHLCIFLEKCVSR